MLQDRVFAAEIVDEEGQPLLGAVLRMYVAGQLGAEIKNPPGGRAVIQLTQTDQPISIEASFGSVKETILLAPDCEKWLFKLPVFQGTHLVILVHGINTRAHWMSSVGRQLKSAGMAVEPAGYGFYGVIRFLLPIDWLRKQAIERVRIRYNAAVQRHHPKRVSVIAHSFGTYVVARLMANEFNIQWHRIIFCGSVNPATFPFEQYTGRFSSPILNDIGTNDVWPAFAESVTWGYGSIGSHGFQGAPLEERWHRGLAHSDFLTAAFAEKFWQPFLENGVVVPADEPEPLPFAIRFLTLLPLRWVLLAAVVALAAYFIPAKIVSTTQSNWSQSSGWLDGGNNQSSVCTGLAAAWMNAHPGEVVEIKTMSEETKRDFVQHVQYRYNCTGVSQRTKFFWQGWF